MTSSGQVTTPDMKPPTAPASALNCESEAFIAHLSRPVIRLGSSCIGSAEAESIMSSVMSCPAAAVSSSSSVTELAGAKVAGGRAPGKERTPYSAAELAGSGPEWEMWCWVSIVDMPLPFSRLESELGLGNRDAGIEMNWCVFVRGVSAGRNSETPE